MSTQFDAIKAGTTEALALSQTDTYDAVTSGTQEAFPFMPKDEVLDAIKEGVREAVAEYLKDHPLRGDE